MINIAIIEDNDELRERFKLLIEQSAKLNCKLAVDSVEKFLRYHHPSHHLDIILSDIGLPGMSGIAGIPHIKNILPDVDIIMLTVSQNEDNIFNAISAGASGYLLKDLNFDQLENMLVDVQENGGSALSPQVARRVLNYFQTRQKPRFFSSKKNNLTKKEMQVIRFLVDGNTYQKTADLIGVSVNGVRFHIKNIYKKLQVRSKAEVIKKYMSGKLNNERENSDS